MAAHGNGHVPHRAKLVSAERIFQYAGVAAFSRSEEDTQALFEEQSQYLAETFHARTTVVNLPR